MNTNRRRLLGALALAPGFPNPREIPIATLRGASTVHGSALSDARLQVIQPALDRRLAELQPLRDLDIDDAVGPTPGILAE